MINIGYSRKRKNYYLWEDKNINCRCCNNTIEAQFILNTVYNKLYKDIEQYPYCHECYNKIKRVLEGTATLVLIEFSNKKLIPVLPQTLLSPTYQQFKGGIGQGVFLLEEEDLSICNMENCTISFDPGRNKMIGFHDNLEQYEKRKEELKKIINSPEEVKKIIKNEI